MFRTGTFWQNDLSISGGNEDNTYFFSLSNLQQDGIMRAAAYDRTNLRFNYRAKLNDKITLSNKAAYTYTNSNRIQQSSNTAGIMLGLLRISQILTTRIILEHIRVDQEKKVSEDIVLTEDMLEIVQTLYITIRYGPL